MSTRCFRTSISWTGIGRFRPSTTKTVPTNVHIFEATPERLFEPGARGLRERANTGVKTACKRPGNTHSPARLDRGRASLSPPPGILEGRKTVGGVATINTNYVRY